jgi:hypothetical protein
LVGWGGEGGATSAEEGIDGGVEGLVEADPAGDLATAARHLSHTAALWRCARGGGGASLVTPQRGDAATAQRCGGGGLADQQQQLESVRQGRRAKCLQK